MVEIKLIYAKKLDVLYLANCDLWTEVAIHCTNSWLLVVGMFLYCNDHSLHTHTHKTPLRIKGKTSL